MARYVQDFVSFVSSVIARTSPHHESFSFIVFCFSGSQNVDDLPGVGWSLGQRLETMGVKTCSDLQKLSLQALQKEFGQKTGLQLYQYCRGIDDRTLRTERERKSVSAEINYGIRFKKVSQQFDSNLVTIRNNNKEDKTNSMKQVTEPMDRHKRQRQLQQQLYSSSSNFHKRKKNNKIVMIKEKYFIMGYFSCIVRSFLDQVSQNFFLLHAMVTAV